MKNTMRRKKMKIYITYTKNSFTEKQVEELSKGGSLSF